MARRFQADFNIGSDSFLDVIANIVGILIILIVIAGLRVSRAPVQLPERAEPVPAGGLSEPVAAPVLAEKWNVPSEEERRLAELLQEAEALALAAPVPNLPPDEDAARLTWLAAERERLHAALARTQAQVGALQTRATQTRARTEELERQAAGTVQARQAGDRDVARLSGQVSAQEQLLAELLKRLKAVPAPADGVRQIKHKVTPISRTVQGPELHFRLAENRVSHIPLETLIERLTKQVERQKDWLLKYPRHQGTVGPAGGYSLQYEVERQGGAVVDQIHHGPGVMRITVAAFKVLPEADLRTESPAEALRVGSDFHVALQSAPKGATLTFWVYPDSFQAYRELQALAHRAGFTVAARPLPFGVPIAGSPNGSRSAGQ